MRACRPLLSSGPLAPSLNLLQMPVHQLGHGPFQEVDQMLADLGEQVAITVAVWTLLELGGRGVGLRLRMLGERG